MQSDYSIKSIFRQYKWKISSTFLLLILENAFKVLQPFVLGIAINDLLNKSEKGLLLFGCLYIAGFIIGVIRRYYDTRAYTSIYTNIASEIAEIQNEKQINISSIAARSALVKELVDFFEQDVTQGFSSVISVIGALVMLLLFDPWIFLSCLITIVLIILIYRLSNSKIYNYNIGLNDELEDRITVLNSRNPNQIKTHFRGISNWLVKLSDLETLNFGIIEILLFVLAIFTIYLSASVDTASAGSIFSAITYVLEFSGGVFMLPFIYQQTIRLKEISSRLSQV